MRRIILLLVCVLVFFSTSPVSGEEYDKRWCTLADNTQVYGYWQEVAGTWILVECNPGTGKETGFAFLNSGKYETREKQVVDRYEYVKHEDLRRVREVKPVIVERVFAPNAPTDTEVDMDYYRGNRGGAAHIVI
ncbi:hypothetical protein [Desulforamulus ruminis]|uniref:Uncharacterized protein n=1 Tax=Desulforamulus ruminis (strain ATCC 23193 / DSM 2154 / NCIMB 8452 / DL) TaxID=696281 RepID=F6DTU7_DESRL|nr:hypothetical protein [Desulforamulus ruminis]AEG58965.1 hypothetical protein Desru_0680 [Desulforamulus ruminis DSM 2154]